MYITDHLKSYHAGLFKERSGTLINGTSLINAFQSDFCTATMQQALPNNTVDIRKRKQ